MAEKVHKGKLKKLILFFTKTGYQNEKKFTRDK